MDSSLKRKFSQLKFVTFDFDGVFTDNRVISDQFGNESVICSRSDGIGLTKLNNLGISTLVISTEKNPVVTKRCEKLKVRCMQGVNDKKDVFENFCSKENINLKDTAFVGNDINDLDVLNICGLPIAVSDSYPEVLKVAEFTTTKPGGFGAVREICDIISSLQTLDS
ncbi:HAD hydrolase family protein [Opitutales bacterium]|nr:HAD hydrolase family protein [Opitutales bacterium]